MIQKRKFKNDHIMEIETSSHSMILEDILDDQKDLKIPNFQNSFNHFT